MPEKKSTPNEPEVTIRDSPEGVFRAYSNHINLVWNAFDFRFHFGDSTLVASDGRMTVDTKAVVTVSWTQAKQISELLSQVLQRYEAANGPIKRVQETQPF